MKILISIFLFLVILLNPAASVSVYAQDEQPDGPIYIVQEGDSLWGISNRFGVPLESLVNKNGITDASQLSIGDELIIPRLEGIQGYLTTDNVSYGDTLRSLSRKHKIPEEMLRKLNHLTTSYELYVDRSLVILEPDKNEGELKRVTINPGQSLFEKAAGRKSQTEYHHSPLASGFFYSDLQLGNRVAFSDIHRI